MLAELLQIKDQVPSVAPDVIFTVFGWPISNSALEITFILILVLIFNFFVIRRFKVEAISRLQHIIEGLYETMLTFVGQITGSRKKAADIAPIILALFVFVGISNLINVIPGLTSITYKGVPIFRTPTSDFNTTFSLALAMIVFIQITAAKRLGLFAYIGRFIRIKPLIQGFRKGIGEGFTALIEFFIGFLDVVSEVAKVFSLSLRLFGNIYAGEVLLVMIFGAFAIALPSLWMSLSLFFGIIQAIVFGALSAAYYASSIPDEDILAPATGK